MSASHRQQDPDDPGANGGRTDARQRRAGQRCIAIALLGAVLLNRPFVTLFDGGPAAMIAGIPHLYLYVFGAWAGLVLLMALAVRRGG